MGMPQGAFCLPHTTLGRTLQKAQPKDRGWGGGRGLYKPQVTPIHIKVENHRLVA